jgi:hypothetical protein
MSKILKSNKGTPIIVDDGVFNLLNKFIWRVNKDGYAYRNTWLGKKRNYIILHRLLINAKKGDIVDHINMDKLDNSLKNLRICTIKESNQHRNRVKGKFLSKLRGVTFQKTTSRYRANIKHDNKRFHLGYFDKEIDAAKAYDKKAKKLFGDFAVLNFNNN